MFKFNFKVNCNADYSQNNRILEDVNEKTEDIIDCYAAEEITPRADIIEELGFLKLNSKLVNVGNVTFRHVPFGFTMKSKDEIQQDIKKAEQEHTDLIPGVYEGGAKIWECTLDLLKYMIENCDNSTFKEKRVLDLGCGTGLLGIYAYKCGACVNFQDYNKDVLENITIPNVILNMSETMEQEHFTLSNLRQKFQFYCGDWSLYADITSKENKFDLILTSETIYNPNNQQKLLNTLHTKLAPAGIVFVAAKTYYFGVGGGLRQFEDAIAADGHFKSEVVWISENGVTREILVLKRKDQ